MAINVLPVTRGDSETAYVCIKRADGTRITALAGFDADDKAQSVKYYDPQENEVPFDAGAGDTVEWGSCSIETECVESLEYTYGLDNTGTTYGDTASYEITLSDGQVLTFDQTPTGGWAAQLTQWASAIQSAADTMGLVWFVEPRFVDNPNPSNIDGTINGPGGTPSGLPGAPSVRIAELLFQSGMFWRYVNFQICPGQPVPVDAKRVASTTYGDDDFILNTAGPIKGVINKFYVCRECGKEPIWYLADNVTLAAAGQIPDCYSPCGLLELQAPPPGSDCQFEFDTACDDMGATDPALFKNLITRRVTYCDGEKVSQEFFEPDPSDPSALLPYTLVGQYVDCDSGEAIPVPPPVCSDFVVVGNLWRIKDTAVIGAEVDWWAPPSFPGGSNAAPNDLVSNIFTVDTAANTLVHVNGAPDVTYTSDTFTVDTLSNDFLGFVGAANTAETTGVDQFRIRGYIVIKCPAIIRDSSPSGRTGEFGGIWIDECCKGKLSPLNENTAISLTPGKTFEGVELPQGIHYIEAVISDASSYADLGVEVSFDGGATYAPLDGYANKPSYECFPVIKCKDSGSLLNIEMTEVIEVGELDSWCKPDWCDGSGDASAQKCAHIVDGYIEEPATDPIAGESDNQESGSAGNVSWETETNVSVPGFTSIPVNDPDIGGDVFRLVHSGPNDTPSTRTFRADDEKRMTGFTIDAFDIDRTVTSEAAWADRVAVLAYDSGGNLLPVTVQTIATSGTMVLGSNSAYLQDNTNVNPEDNQVRFTVDGLASEVQVVLDNEAYDPAKDDNLSGHLVFLSNAKWGEVCVESVPAFVCLDENCDPVGEPTKKAEIGLVGSGNSSKDDEIIAKLCEISDLLTCDEVEACYRTSLFHDADQLDVGETQTYEICVDGTTVSTIVHDHLSTFDGTNRSTMYTPVISALNGLAGWTFTLLSEVGPNQAGKQEWQVDYSGAGDETLEVKLNGDIIRWHVAADGTMTAQAFTSGSAPASVTEPNIDFNTPIHRPCE